MTAGSSGFRAAENDPEPGVAAEVVGWNDPGAVGGPQLRSVVEATAALDPAISEALSAYVTEKKASMPDAFT